jgi:hypothetical protein
MLEKAVRISRRVQWTGVFYGAVALALILATIVGGRAIAPAMGATPAAILDQGSANTSSAAFHGQDGTPQPPR